MEMHNVMDPFVLTRFLMAMTMTLLAAINDVRYQRIPNVLIGTFLSLGVLAWVQGHGVIGFWYSLGPSFFILLFLLPLFVLRALAGGDIKLFAAIAGITGIELFIPIFIYSLLAGGIVGLMIWIRRRPRISWAENQAFMVGSLESGGDHPGISLQDDRFPFGVPIFMGTILGLLGEVNVASWL
jgi:prepilin peptidase CpaA